MDYNIISKIFEDLLSKCSNSEIREQLSVLSPVEKRMRLDTKMNPLEKKDYTELINEIKFWEEDIGRENMSPEQIEEIETKHQEVFNYEKRIVLGYNLDKNKKNVPSIDTDSFQEDTVKDLYDESITGLEKNQIDYQDERLNLSDLSVQGLQSYFGSDYKHINGELDKNYRDGYWSRLTPEQRKEYHEQNKVIVPNIDRAITDSPGLLVDTVLYHGSADSSIISIHNRIGDTLNLKGYISTSFNRRVGEAYGKGVGGFLVKFLAPKGTKGICANTSKEYLTYENGEHEYLLGRNNKGIITDIDYDSEPPVATVVLE